VATDESVTPDESLLGDEESLPPHDASAGVTNAAATKSANDLRWRVMSEFLQARDALL
jgi:hypothetical protein